MVGKTETPTKLMLVKLTKRKRSNAVKLYPNVFLVESCGELIPTPDLSALTPVTDLVSPIHPDKETQVIPWSRRMTCQSRSGVWIGCLLV